VDAINRAPQHLHEERTEKSGRRIRLHALFAEVKQVGTAIHIIYIAALR
jgi:hypothetical protein